MALASQFGVNRQDGTEYSIAIIPLGGYVKMLDGRVDEIEDAEKQFAFDRKPLWKRTAIVSAGQSLIFCSLFLPIGWFFDWRTCG